MFKLGAKIVFLLRHLFEKMSAGFSAADRRKFWKAEEKAVPDQNWIGGHIDVESGFQSLKSTIAETGMGVTSRP